MKAGDRPPCGGTTAAAARASAGEDRILPVKPRRGGSRIVFAGPRLAWLKGDELVLLSPTVAEDVRVPVKAGRGVSAIGEDVIAVGMGKEIYEVVRVRGDRSVERWPALFIGISNLMIRIFAERDRFWLVAAGEIRSIAFELDRGTLPLGDPIPIVRPDTPGEVEVARLDRSAFLVLEAKGLVEIAVDGARRPILLPPTVVTPTLLAADTERHVWLSGEWGGLAAVDLTAPSRAPICAALLPEERAHALAASADRVAAVTIRGDVNAPRWSVAVFGPDGRELLRVDVPWELPLSAPDVSVAIGGTPLSLAVATDERLAVWDLASGRKILER